MGRPETPAGPAVSGRMMEREIEDIGDDEGQDLPSYEQSACIPKDEQPPSVTEEQDGGRFGRWGGWVEKRGLERQVEDGREERRQARREIGPHQRPPSYDNTVASVLNVPLNEPPRHRLSPVPRALGTPLPPTDLTRLEYGSRFITHSANPITCTLALDNSLTLFGSTDGLRVLLHNGEEDPTRAIWTGVAVWDMTLLKQDTANGGIPRWTILVLCGGVEDGNTGRPRRDGEGRLYKLESLTSLAQWASLQYGHEGLDLLPKKDKGKGIASSFRSIALGSGSSSSKSPFTPAPEPRGIDLAKRWAADYTVLPVGGRAVLSMATHITSTEMAIALATPDSVVLHLGKVTSTGSFSFAPAKTFYIPFPPRMISIVELEIPGSVPEPMDDCSSSLFEWDDDRTESTLGEGVVGGLLGLFVTFAGARGCVVRTNDLRIVELKKGGRGEWLPAQKVTLLQGEVYVFTRGSSSYLFGAPLTIPLALQTPITEITGPELPTSVYATTTPASDIRLLGLTSRGTIHVIDLSAGERGLERDWASVAGALGEGARFIPDIKPRSQDARGEVEGVLVGYRKGEKDWRIVRLGQQT